MLDSPLLGEEKEKRRDPSTENQYARPGSGMNGTGSRTETQCGAGGREGGCY